MGKKKPELFRISSTIDINLTNIDHISEIKEREIIAIESYFECPVCGGDVKFLEQPVCKVIYKCNKCDKKYWGWDEDRPEPLKKKE